MLFQAMLRYYCDYAAINLAVIFKPRCQEVGAHLFHHCN